MGPRISRLAPCPRRPSLPLAHMHISAASGGGDAAFVHISAASGRAQATHMHISAAAGGRRGGVGAGASEAEALELLGVALPVLGDLDVQVEEDPLPQQRLDAAA